MNAPHDIQTATTLIRAGQKVNAILERHGDGSAVIAIKCKREVVRIAFDSITEANNAGWEV
jgi:hypothetical protein